MSKSENKAKKLRTAAQTVEESIIVLDESQLRELFRSSEWQENTEVKEKFVESAVKKLPKKDVREILEEQAVEDRKSERSLRIYWARLILMLLIVVVFFNFLTLILYGLGVLEFADTNVIKVFLGGSIATIPVLAFTITKFLFPDKKVQIISES